MTRTRLIIVGGFLGSGKTTSILALAVRLSGAGYKVGIVTNDHLIILNKTDLLKPEEITEMLAGLGRRYPGSEVLPVSARAGTGLDDWASRLFHIPDEAAAAVDLSSLEIDYSTYARAEAALGWLNTTAQLAAPAVIPLPAPADGNAFLLSLAELIKMDLTASQWEIAHLKAYLVAGSDWCKLSCVGLADPIEFDRRMTVPFSQATLVLNVRAAADPDRLRQTVSQALISVSRRFDLIAGEPVTEAFSPPYPRPVF